MSDTEWGKIDIANWQAIPVLQGRCANESDVADGRAVFYVPTGDEYEPSEVVDLKLPRAAILSESSTPIFIIQAEKVNGKVAVGYRLVTGGNGICMLNELELLSEPDERFA